MSGRSFLRFLIVEDDARVAMSHERVLRGHGQTELALSAAEARRRFDAPPGEWSGVILDLRIPGVEGLELLELLRQHDEHVPVLVVTGADSDDNLVNAIQSFGAQLAKKPIALENYNRFVEQCRLYGGIAAAGAAVAERLAEEWSLTERQATVLELVLAGQSRAEIAGRLEIGLDAARKHVRAILAKSGLGDTRDILAYALRRCS